MTGSVKAHMKQAVPSLVIMLLMVMAASFASSRFFTAANLRNVLTQTAVLAIVSVAQCTVLFVGGIDMSVSSVISMSTICIAMFSGDSLGGLLLGIVLAMAKGICLILMPSSGGKVNQGFVRLIKTKWGIFSVAFLLTVVLYLLFYVLFHYTRFGRKVYAMGNGELYASQSGIDTKKMTVLVYAISGMISAFAGIILSARISSGNPLVGDSYAMDSVAAAVIGGVSMNGGIGSVAGALCGAVILSLINNIMNNLGISPYYQYIIKGLLLMFSMMLFQLKRRKTV